MPRLIKASEFKAKCLALMDEVANTGDAIVVTKNGKPLVTLVPHRAPKRSPLGIWKGKVIIKGDIVAPRTSTATPPTASSPRPPSHTALPS